MNDRVGIARVNGKTIEIYGTDTMRKAVKTLSKFGLITFSREIRFKSTVYAIDFFKPVESLSSMYGLGNEILVLCCLDSMHDFKSRTKDFIDYILVTNTEFKNRLDKVTCILIDGNINITKYVKEDRIENSDSRLIVPFYTEELENGISEEAFNNRLRDYLYERDLFGISSPLKNDTLFFGKDRTDVISELFARYKQGEEGGLFGLRRIGKTSILYLLKRRIVEAGEVAVYFDCSSSHHYKWNEFLKYIIEIVVNNYSNENDENGNNDLHEVFVDKLIEERYDEKMAVHSFSNDISEIYRILGEKRILLIFDEIESISFSTSPSEWWRKENDSLFFWQAIRSIIQMKSECLSFVVAGVNPMCIENPSINNYDNPIFGMFSPIYVSLFEYDDIKRMISSIGKRLGLEFEESIYTKLMEDYGGHPYLIRQVCSKINNNLYSQKIKRPTLVTRYSYMIKSDEYKLEMTSVIEQILGVVEKYYPREFEMLKRLALDGRNAFKREISSGERSIQHLVGYCLVEKADGEYFIRIKSIEDYLKSKYIFDSMLTEQSDKRARINLRRDVIEEKLRQLILLFLQSKYGKKAKDQLISVAEKTTNDSTQKTKMINAPTLKKAIEELYLSQIKDIMEKDWKNYAAFFPDKSKFEAYTDILNRSRRVGAHTKTVTEDDEVLYGIAFEYFENALEDVE